MRYYRVCSCDLSLSWRLWCRQFRPVSGVSVWCGTCAEPEELVRAGPGGEREPIPADFYAWIVRARKAQNQALHAHDTVNLCIETAQRPQLEAAQSAGVGTLLWFPMGSDTVENVQKAVSLLDGVGPKDKVICGNDLPQLASAILHAGL